MAEGLARSMGMEAMSAGTHPAGEVAANALKVLASKGISTDGMRPKGLEGVDHTTFDKIISMGCGVHCPALPIDKDWGLEDPVGGHYDVYVDTAEEIERRLLALLEHS